MKHLLIILSFILFSSPLFGQSTSKVTLYKWETSDGFKWKKFGGEGIHEKYEGEVSWGGKPNGLGTLFYHNGDKYYGEFEDGFKDGLGTYIWSNHEDTEKYIGEFTNDEFGKTGKIFYKSGQIYEGEVFTEYVDGKFNDFNFGKGIKTLPDGGKYEGVWSRKKDDKIFRWKIKGYNKDGEKVLEIYEGNGKGLYFFTDGGKYVGAWKDGKEHGQGTYTWSNGQMYVGESKDGKYDGQGTFTWSNGDTYEGEYKDGGKHGQGTYTWFDGDTYEGEYKDGERHGQGTYTWSGGKKYEGKYKDGKIDGKGTQTFSDGAKWTGEFRKNKRWNTTIYNKNGHIIGKFVNGTEYDKIGNIIGSGWME